LPEGTALVKISPRSGRIEYLVNKPREGWRSRIIDTAITIILIAIIVFILVLNLFFIAINASTPGKEIAIRGTIPYVFQSRTMEPAIMLNDLVYFQKIDSEYPLSEGQIILFRDGNIAYVERIIEQTENELIVDIDNYPSMTQPGTMLKSVSRLDVYGVYSGRSRWLGVLILFANTTVGRLLFLLVPAVLLYYHKQLIKYLKIS
jgi:hypothetical protein